MGVLYVLNFVGCFCFLSVLVDFIGVVVVFIVFLFCTVCYWGVRTSPKKSGDFFRNLHLH